MRDVTGNGGGRGERRFITKAPSSTHDLQILEEPPEMHLYKACQKKSVLAEQTASSFSS